MSTGTVALSPTLFGKKNPCNQRWHISTSMAANGGRILVITRATGESEQNQSPVKRRSNKEVQLEEKLTPVDGEIEPVSSFAAATSPSSSLVSAIKSRLDESLLNPKQTDAKEDGQPQAFMPPGELKEPQINEGSKSLSNDSDSEAVKTSEEQTDASNSHDKTLKKPDKILPCPRCNSMDTKFCYFNNYNVSQPRHFCKNCQRYWTAGGTMRNVPVGAGRRKNKSQFHPLSLPEALHNGTDLNPNGTVLTFSSDASLPKSMASSLNIADKTNRNGPHRPEELQRISLSCGSKENENNESSVTATTCSKDEIPNSHPFPQFFPGAPWPYPWNPIPCIGPTFGPTSFPGAPWPYWASWAVPWVIPPTATTLQRPGPNSPTLGKHSRDDNVAKPEKCLWIPKTLRIDDPEEAAKSSIWETLGIKNERLDSVGGRGIFKVFGNQSKGDEKAHVPEPSAILQANPAALSRSNNFHESS